MVRVDPKHAHQALERGIKAESDGRIDEALAAYDEAARYAPQDLALVGRGAAGNQREVSGGGHAGYHRLRLLRRRRLGRWPR